MRARTAKRQRKKAHYVTCDTYVTMSDGTGIVHIAPAFGEDDAQVGRRYDLPLVQFVDEKGEMTDDTPYGGRVCQEGGSHDLKGSGRRGQTL